VKVKLILPAPVEVRNASRRHLKYSLFPPLGLATLAGYLRDGDEVSLQDEHVERLRLDDHPDLVGIEVYSPCARRAYEIADLYRSRGCHVAMGGLHVTSLPEESARHADTVFAGPGEDTWPEFLTDWRAGKPRAIYRSTVRTLEGLPPPRRDLFRRELYLVPNSIVVSRGCPHRCDFCYKEAFFRGGASFYTRRIDDALREIDSLPGRHLYFLDDHLLADPHFATELFEGMRGMGRVWQSAGTVASILRPGLVEKAAACGLSSLFVGFETLNEDGLRAQGKTQNLHRDYALTVRKLHDLGVMVNASFVFGMDEDDASVFDRTVDWAISQGIETATFHILTPYPGTELRRRLVDQRRITTNDWNLYDTHHAVFQPARMTAAQLEAGQQRAYDRFYRWSSVFAAAATKGFGAAGLRHLVYTAAWKKLDPVWAMLIRTGHIGAVVPLLECVLSGHAARRHERGPGATAPAPIRP
jgi:radical SAM superfamily enzyme YgiQ (UPF0313 family)